MKETSTFLFLAIFTLFVLIKCGVSTQNHGRAEEICGHPLGMVSGKIVGGYDVGYYKYPWFVALYKDNVPYCGATLISKKTIVTAAHCFQQYVSNPKGIEKEYELRMGTYNICNTHEATLKKYEARKIYIHEKYAKEDPFFDIALIVLKQDVEFEPACLPQKQYDSKERPKEAIIAGYGVLRYQDYKTSCVMREARVKIYSDKACKKMLKKVDPEVDNFANAFCAGYLEGGVDGCQGDSGGPLMVLTSNSRFTLLGLTSFGYKCAAKDLLGIYTDVSHYLDWIDTKTNTPITDNPPDGSGDGEGEGDEDEDGESDDNESDDTGDDDDDNDDDDNDDDDNNDDDDENPEKKRSFVSLEKKKGNIPSRNHHKKYVGDKKHHHYHQKKKKKEKKTPRTRTAIELMKIHKKHKKSKKQNN